MELEMFYNASVRKGWFIDYKMLSFLKSGTLGTMQQYKVYYSFQSAPSGTDSATRSVAQISL